LSLNIQICKGLAHIVLVLRGLTAISHADCLAMMMFVLMTLQQTRGLSRGYDVIEVGGTRNVR